MSIDWEYVEKHGELDEDGVMRCFLGTVFSLTPSGKYYTAFASGNVTDEEIAKDQLWWERMEDEAAGFDTWIESGEGDPCDIYICWEA